MQIPDRIIVGLLALALAFFAPLASAQSPINTFPPGMFSNKAAATGCSEATAFIGRAGLSGTDATNYTTMICGIVNDGKGTWALLDVLVVPGCAPDPTSAKLNLKQNAFNATYHGTPPESSQFAPHRGYTGDGGGAATVYLDTGYAPLTNGGLSVNVNSFSMSLYDTSLRGLNFLNSVEMGTSTSGFSSFSRIAAFLNTGTQQFTINDANFYGPTISATSAQGYWGETRVSSSVLTPYLNSAAQTASTGNNTTALASFNMYVLAWNNLGTAAGFSADTVAAYHMAAGLSDPQMVSLMNAVNGCLQAVGASVY